MLPDVSAPAETDRARGAVRREETDRPGVRRHVPLGPLPSAGLSGFSEEDPASLRVVEGLLADPLEDTEVLTDLLLQRALERGAVGAGVFPLEPFEGAEEHLRSWLEAGHQGIMTYLEGPERRGAPQALLPEARSGLVIAVPCPPDLGGPRDAGAKPVPSRRVTFNDSPDSPLGPGSATADVLRGRVARYARGADYHQTLRGILLHLADLAALLLKRPVLGRACVDTAPLLEREAAVRAGLAFVGKNTLAILPGVGSHVLLAEILWDVPLSPGSRVAGPERPRARARDSQAPALRGCGSCTVCLTACPTGAFVGPYVLDARRCISYLTIEFSGVLPEELRAPMGTHVFGCDVCQDVCPFNRGRGAETASSLLGAHERLTVLDLIGLLELGAAGYRRLVTKTALRRTHRAQLARNAAVALGNSGDPRALAPLTRALTEHTSPLVRGHAAWALGRLLETLPRSTLESFGEAANAARHALTSAAENDADPWVREESARAALRAVTPQRRLPLVATPPTPSAANPAASSSTPSSSPPLR